ncbi:hypothetical protein N7491_006244 [Penicillium cf. griseofulvum]|nr:hypothetical protein N7491_006244 [Penicillium cf. griseofulvum]
MSKTRWGELHNKPSETVLSPATKLEVTEFFDPQILSGEKRERQVSTTQVNPKVGIGSSNLEGAGWSQRLDKSYASRWKFTGSRFVAAPSSSSDAFYSRKSRYQQLVWHLEENELENQAVHHSTVHTAVAFHHDSGPFYLDLQIQVKLHRWHHPLKQRLVCPPRSRRAYTRARINTTSNVDPDLNFAQLARNLDHDMIEANLQPVVGTFT